MTRRSECWVSCRMRGSVWWLWGAWPCSQVIGELFSWLTRWYLLAVLLCPWGGVKLSYLCPVHNIRNFLELVYTYCRRLLVIFPGPHVQWCHIPPPSLLVLVRMSCAMLVLVVVVHMIRAAWGRNLALRYLHIVFCSASRGWFHNINFQSNTLPFRRILLGILINAWRFLHQHTWY